MSKKTHKMALMKEEAKTKKPDGKETGAGKRMASGKKPHSESRNAGGRSASAKPVSKGAARSFDRPAAKTPPANLMTVRIVALLVAAAALAGGVYWIIQVQGQATFAVVVGLIALGFVAGMSIFTAIRTEEVIHRARVAMQRR